MLLSHLSRTLTGGPAFSRPVSAINSLYQQTRDVIRQLRLRRRGCRAGKHHRRRVDAARRMTSLNVIAGSSVQPGTISVIVGNRCTTEVQRARHDGDRKSVLKLIQPRHRSQYGEPAVAVTSPAPPTLYVLNAASLAKPYAIQHLTADLTSYDVQIAVITDTHFKKQHADHFATIAGYSLFRRDRAGRKGGGVAVYVNSRMSATLWTCPNDSPLFELLWVHVCMDVRDVIVGALYHPPKPIYQTSEFLNHIEVCLDAVESAFPAALVWLVISIPCRKKMSLHGARCAP